MERSEMERLENGESTDVERLEMRVGRLEMERVGMWKDQRCRD